MSRTPSPARVEVGPPEPDARRLRWRSLVLFAASLGTGFFTLLLAGPSESKTLAVVGFGLASLLALAGFGYAAVALWRAVTGAAIKPGPLLFSLALAGVNGATFLLGVGAAFLSTAEFARGRQLRSLGRVLLAPLARGTRWLPRSDQQVEAPAELRTLLAAQWRENGRTEHASVAAFARLSLDLMSLGAPAALVAGAHADALDEVRHTESCFALARALDGQRLGPAAFPEAAHTRSLPGGRTLALSLLAVDSLIDGALHEGVSARVVAQLARRCPEPQIRAVLKQIALDEGRHAAHGWEVVEFCLREGGEPVARALQGAARVLPTQLSSSFHPAARDGGWERYGIPGEALERAEFAKARAHLLLRLATLTASRVA